MSTEDATPEPERGPSDNYRELTVAEAEQIDLGNRGWLDPTMPMRQYETIVHKELESFRRGGHVAPYDVLVALLRAHPITPNATLLDVGCSSGYYSQVLKAREIPYSYTGLDFSPHYATFAKTMFGSDIVDFIVADASDMYMIPSRSFDVVVTGGVLMHMMRYREAIAEIQRIASQQIVFHRTPVALDDLNRYYMKTAYGLPCVEIHFNEGAFRKLIETEGWTIIDMMEVSFNDEEAKGHVSYMLERR